MITIHRQQASNYMDKKKRLKINPDTRESTTTTRKQMSNDDYNNCLESCQEAHKNIDKHTLEGDKINK